MHPSGLAVTSCRAANSQVQTFPVYWQKTTLKNLDGVWRVENLGMGAGVAASPWAPGGWGRLSTPAVDFTVSAAPFSRWTGCALLLVDRHNCVLTGLSRQVLGLFLLHCSGCWFRVDIRAAGLLSAPAEQPPAPVPSAGSAPRPPGAKLAPLMTVGPSEGPFRLGNGLKEAHREPLGQTLGFSREAESTVASRPHRALSCLAGPEAPRSAPRIFLLPFTSIARPPCQGTLTRQPPKMNPVVEPLSWMLGTWLSDPPGAGTFPTLQPFHYLEEVHISHVGQPMLNFSFNAFHPDTHKPMHRECGFIRLEPDTNKVAFVSAQNTGIVEVEEGEVNGQELCIASHSIARISFAKEPHVEQGQSAAQVDSHPEGRRGVTSGSLPAEAVGTARGLVLSLSDVIYDLPQL
ncbi:hypothetical protein J1605_010966 [Eschrichtius robustus]|uniref:THAP4-like heme-binding domain-containing protein n=1 Tax=Eschrichtius robustus TaxID=9764 RepID=A0AB34GR10_ESCRO|nr:hypothetical protein J1605_010966 [Eschrichtius robustus]